MSIPPDLDPRVERTRKVVLEAAAELIGECGFGRTSVEAISERSGVARSTIYRHWPERDALLFESVGKKMERIQASYTGELRADLILTFSHLGEMLSDEHPKHPCVLLRRINTGPEHGETEHQDHEGQT